METLEIATNAKTEFVDITDRVQQLVSDAGFTNGVCYVFVPHTTAGVTLNENWDPDVQRDMLLTLNDNVAPRDNRHRHVEGNSPAHIKASLMGSSVLVFVENGRLQLGRWQGIYLAEFDGARQRTVWLKLQSTDT